MKASSIFSSPGNLLSAPLVAKRDVSSALVALTGIGLGAGVGWRQAARDVPRGGALTCGPVHEACARDIIFNPDPAAGVTKAPPDNLEEVLPKEGRPIRSLPKSP
jgi:hypothetical protein